MREASELQKNQGVTYTFPQVIFLFLTLLDQIFHRISLHRPLLTMPLQFTEADKSHHNCFFPQYATYILFLSGDVAILALVKSTSF